MSTFDQIQEILCVQLDLDPKLVQPETTLDELGADSVDMVDLAMTIEDEFQIEVPEEDLENMKTVADVVSFVDSR